MDKKFIIRNELEEDYDDVENLTREDYTNICNEVFQELEENDYFGDASEGQEEII